MGQRAIDGGAGDFVGHIFELLHQLVGLEKSFLAKRGVEDHGPFRCEFELVVVQITPEDGADGFIGQDLVLGFGGKFLFLDAGKNVRPLGHSSNNSAATVSERSMVTSTWPWHPQTHENCQRGRRGGTMRGYEFPSGKTRAGD